MQYSIMGNFCRIFNFTRLIIVFGLQKIKPTPVTVTPEEKAALLSMMYPKNRSKPMNPRKKYQCAVCKSACDLFGLFFHMKKVSVFFLVAGGCYS